jgi:hypothetical protein
MERINDGSGLGKVKIQSSCERGNELLGSIKCYRVAAQLVASHVATAQQSQLVIKQTNI